MEKSLEQRVRNELGFYPSYLAAIDNHEACAELIWNETRRVVTESWSQKEGLLVARRAKATTEKTTPMTVVRKADRTNFESDMILKSVEFFSFVMFRLGLGISACRYGLDTDPIQRLDGQSSLRGREETELPPLIARGVKTSLPLDREFPLVDPDDASGEIAAVYDSIKHKLDTPNINNVFRAFAVDPEFLSQVADLQIQIREQATDQDMLETRLRGLYVQALESHTLSLTQQQLRDVATDKEAVNAVTDTLKTFQENLSTLILTLYLGALSASH